MANVSTLSFIQTRDPFEYRIVQAVFAMMLTVPIAIMAVARKFTIVDVDRQDPLPVPPPASPVIALVHSYRLPCDDSRHNERAAIVLNHQPTQ